MIGRASAAFPRKARVAAVVMARTSREFKKNRGTLLAAAISYHVLLSLFPLAIVLVAIAGLVLRDDALRERTLEEVVRLISLDESGMAEVAGMLESVASGQSAIGFAALLGMVWTASSVMSAVRRSFSMIWGQRPRPFLRGKILDIGLVLGVGVLVGLSLALTLTTQAVRRLSERADDEIGSLGAGADALSWAVGTAAPILLSFAVFTLAYSVIPSVRQPFRDIWPGALLAAVAFEGLKIGFSFYLANFASYHIVYGSLAAVVAFMVFVYLSSILLLACAEIVSETGIARVEAAQAREPPAPAPLREKTKRVLRRLLVHDAPPRSDGEETASTTADPLRGDPLTVHEVPPRSEGEETGVGTADSPREDLPEGPSPARPAD